MIRYIYYQNLEQMEISVLDRTWLIEDWMAKYMLYLYIVDLSINYALKIRVYWEIFKIEEGHTSMEC